MSAPLPMSSVAWEYRAKWCEEDEKTAKACASGLEGGGAGTAKAPLQTNVKLRRFRSFTCPITLVLSIKNKKPQFGALYN